MSNSDDQLFLLPQSKHQIRFNLFQFPSSQYPTTTDPDIDRNSEEEEEAFDQNTFILQFPPQESISKDDESVDSSAEKSTTPVSLGDLNTNEDDDGFKTPDSSDRKIPEVKQCPPAPRKPKPIKRKAPQGHVRRNLQLDLSEEVESLFPRSVLLDFNRKIKKARTAN